MLCALTSCWDPLTKIEGAGIACWLKRRTRDREVASSNPGRSGWGIFFSRVNLCADSYSVSVIPPPGYRSGTSKTPVILPKSACGRLHLNTRAPLTQRSRSGLTMLLSRDSVGNYPKTSSRATLQGTLGHTRLSSLSHCGLILA